MASRTNKQGIASKKAQLRKQDAKDMGVVGVETNPRGHGFHRFQKGRKICRETRLRVDPDGFRFVKRPSGGSDFVEVPTSGWLRKKLVKNTTKR